MFNIPNDFYAMLRQSMLDFDFVCRREEPSVSCMVYPFTGDHKQKFYWGHKEVLIPGKTISIGEFIRGSFYSLSIRYLWF